MPEPGHPVTLTWDDRRCRHGREATLQVEAGDRLLDAAIEAGLDVPFSCRWGSCGVCTGRLISGELEHVEPPRVLHDGHLDRGYVLPCVATPRSACRLEVGDRFIDELLTVTRDASTPPDRPTSEAFGWSSGD